MLVVRAAEQTDPIHRMTARQSKAIDVIELERILLVAPSPRLVREGAPPAVAREDRTPDVIRDMARRNLVWGRRFALPGFATHTEPLFFHLGDQSVERHLDDRRQIAVRHAMTQKCLGFAQLVAEGRVYGGGLHKVEPKELAQIPARLVLESIQAHVRIEEQMRMLFT